MAVEDEITHSHTTATFKNKQPFPLRLIARTKQIRHSRAKHIQHVNIAKLNPLWISNWTFPLPRQQKISPRLKLPAYGWCRRRRRFCSSGFFAHTHTHTPSWSLPPPMPHNAKCQIIRGKFAALATFLRQEFLFTPFYVAPPAAAVRFCGSLAERWSAFYHKSRLRSSTDEWKKQKPIGVETKNSWRNVMKTIKSLSYSDFSSEYKVWSV